MHSLNSYQSTYWASTYHWDLQKNTIPLCKIPSCVIILCLEWSIILSFCIMCEYSFPSVLADQKIPWKIKNLVFAILLVGLAGNIFLEYLCVSTQYWCCEERKETYKTLFLYVQMVIFLFFFCHNLFWCHGSGYTILSVCSDLLGQYLCTTTEICMYWLYFIPFQPSLDLSGPSLLISVDK